MRKIKFRGLNTADGSEGMTTFTLNELLATSEDYDLVDPDTVQQLVGYDQDGKEVYEGDVVVDERGVEWKGVLNHAITLPQFEGDEPFHCNCKLKEARHD